MIALMLIGLLTLGETPFEPLNQGDPLWVGRGMALGFNLPFGKRLTVKRVRVLLGQEFRLVFEEYPRRFYLRTDFGPDYAFREDPKESFDFSEEQWAAIIEGRIEVGISKKMFLCIKPRAHEIHVREDPGGPIEQWIYRANPVQLFGADEQNPPTHIYYFQKDFLIAIL